MNTESTTSPSQLTFITPSKFSVTIREQNGEDDETISKMKNAVAGDSVDKFLSGIIIAKDGVEGKLSSSEVSKWKTKDRHYIAFKSRIHSLGAELNFTHTCSNPNCNKPNAWEEDLAKYDRDFSKPDEESKNGFKFQITPYPNKEANVLEFGTSKGKKLRYKLHNGETTIKAMNMDKNEVSKNTPLTLRELEWYNNEQWVKVGNFREFSSKEMTEIRKHIDLNDDTFDAWSEMPCPYCNQIDEVSLISQPDFFFPGEQ